RRRRSTSEQSPSRKSPAESAAAPDRAGITAFRGSTFTRRPRQVNCGVRRRKTMSRSNDTHRGRQQAGYADWLKQRSVLGAYRGRSGGRRTAPQAVYDMGKVFPELAGRSGTAVRLHPRYGDEPPADASKLGGTFLWPAAEGWPVCPAHEVPFVTVLQL